MSFKINKNLKLIIFGGLKTAKYVTNELKRSGLPFEIIAYANNDEKLLNTFWFDKPVIHPKEIMKYEYDQIILSSGREKVRDEIFKQLITEYKIPHNLLNTDFNFMKDSITARINALKNAAEIIYEKNIKGAVAELGVYKGGFAQYINTFFPDREIYLFDTFEGFENNDVKNDLELGVKKTILEYDFSDTGEEFVIKRMKYPEKCIFKKGYFPETAKNIEEKFAFVSLDADLYQPMFEGLKYFYPRLESGGYMFIHDYFSEIFTGTKKAVIEYCGEFGIHYVPLGDNISIAIIK